MITQRRGNTMKSKGKGSKGSKGSENKGKDGNAAARHHRQMSSSPVNAGLSVGHEAFNETVRSTESPERYHGKVQPFSGLDGVAAFSTLFGLGSTAYSQMTAGESLWSSGVFATASAWCAFLASFFSTRQGFAELRAEMQEVHAAVHRIDLASKKSQPQESIKRNCDA